MSVIAVVIPGVGVVTTTLDMLLVSAAVEVARSMGLILDESAAAESRNSVDIAVDGSQEVVAGTSLGQQKVFRGDDGIEAIFHRDAQGRPAVRVTGDRDKDELREIGKTMAGRISQQYAYHRLVGEMRQRNMNIVEDEVAADGTVRLRVRAAMN